MAKLSVKAVKVVTQARMMQVQAAQRFLTLHQAWCCIPIRVLTLQAVAAAVGQTFTAAAAVALEEAEAATLIHVTPQGQVVQVAV